MAQLSDIDALLSKPNHAVISTLNADGSVHSTIIWINVEGRKNIAFNSARGRVWPGQPRARPAGHADAAQPGRPVRVRRAQGHGGRGRRGRRGRPPHGPRSPSKYLDADVDPWRKEGEERVKFQLAPAQTSRHVKA